MIRKFWTLIGFLLITAMILTACGGGEAEGPGEAPATGLEGTVSIWHSLKEGEIEGLNAAMASFEEANPGVTFDLLFIPDDDKRGKFETAAATGEGACILIGSADWGPAFYDADLVTDLTPLASESFLNGINQAALNSVRYKDALVGLPLGLKGVVMYRNSSIVADAPSSFDDLVAKAQAATSGDVVGASLERGPFFAFAHLNPLGGGLMSPEGDPTFNNETGVAWLTMLDRFDEAGPAEINNDNDVNLFKAGKAGVIIDGTWNMNDLAAAIGADNLQVDPWPSDMSGYVQNDNIYLNSNATGNDETVCFAFMQHLLLPETQAAIAESNKGFIPAALGVDVTDRLRAAAVAAFADGVAFPVIPEMGAYWGPMETAIRTVVDQGGDPAAALQQAETDVNAKIVEIRGGQ
jgi:arabinogalactan oligomer/maltooligosaccharide transport system substrate-binding protein